MSDSSFENPFPSFQIFGNSQTRLLYQSVSGDLLFFNLHSLSLDIHAKNLSCALESSNDSTLLRFLYCRKQIFKRREKRFQIWNKTFETFPIYGCSIIPRMGWKSEVARREKVRNCRIRPRERERDRCNRDRYSLDRFERLFAAFWGSSVSRTIKQKVSEAIGHS